MFSHKNVEYARIFQVEIFKMWQNDKINRNECVLCVENFKMITFCKFRSQNVIKQ